MFRFYPGPEGDGGALGGGIITGKIKIIIGVYKCHQWFSLLYGITIQVNVVFRKK
jgi:hypothetical protein